MKNIMAVMLIFISANLFGQYTVEITVKGVTEIKGTLLMAVYDTDAGFLKKHVNSKKAKISENTVTVIFENVKAGDYAFTTFHDLNDNEKLDSNFVGLPKEPYGFSNDAKGSFGPPSFEKTKVKIDSDKKLVINLR